MRVILVLEVLLALDILALNLPRHSTLGNANVALRSRARRILSKVPANEAEAGGHHGVEDLQLSTIDPSATPLVPSQLRIRKHRYGRDAGSTNVELRISLRASLKAGLLHLGLLGGISAHRLLLGDPADGRSDKSPTGSVRRDERHFQGTSCNCNWSSTNCWKQAGKGVSDGGFVWIVEVPRSHDIMELTA